MNMLDSLIFALIVSFTYMVLANMFPKHYWTITVLFFIAALLWLLFVTAYAVSTELLFKTFILF